MVKLLGGLNSRLNVIFKNLEPKTVQFLTLCHFSIFLIGLELTVVKFDTGHLHDINTF